MQTNIFCKRDDFGQDKRGLRSRGRELAASFPAPPSSLPGCFLGRVSPSFPPRPGGRLPARRSAPTALLGAAGPAGLGAAGGEERRRRRGGDPVQHSSRGVASFLRPGEAPPPPRWSPRPGLPVPGPGRVPCRCPPRSRGTARLEHQCFGIPAKSRASELSILIEIAGLGTAGGCLYRFDFCCSGKHITND